MDVFKSHVDEIICQQKNLINITFFEKIYCILVIGKDMRWPLNRTENMNYKVMFCSNKGVGWSWAPEGRCDWFI